ncbi:MAG: HNH endonuclease [Cyclobacteriaceae bacterium]
MPKSSITELQGLYIQANFLKESSNDIGRKFGISGAIVKRYMHKHGLKVPRELSKKFAAKKLEGKSIFTDEQDEILKAKYLTLPVKALAKEIGVSATAVTTRMKHLNLIVPREIIEKRKKESCFQKGANPWNAGKRGIHYSRSTEFKKGNKPGNTLSDGAITKRTQTSVKTGLKYQSWHIRVSEAKWIQLNRWMWEKYKGPIPKGHIIVFKDGNSLHCELSNLECISMSENARRNHNYAKAAHTHHLNWQEGGTDKRIASYIVGKDKQLQDLIITSHPELIDLKRSQFELKRTIRS